MKLSAVTLSQTIAEEFVAVNDTGDGFVNPGLLDKLIDFIPIVVGVYVNVFATEELAKTSEAGVNVPPPAPSEGVIVPL